MTASESTTDLKSRYCVMTCSELSTVGDMHKQNAVQSLLIDRNLSQIARVAGVSRESLQIERRARRVVSVPILEAIAGAIELVESDPNRGAVPMRGWTR